MEKDFDKWNKEKQELNTLDYDNFFVNPRDIYFTKMGLNIGYEQNGKTNFLRPILVLKKIGNLFFTIALTSKGKNNKYYHKFESAYFNKDNQKYAKSSSCILSQVKVMDKRRFTDKIGYIGKEEFLDIKEKLKVFLL